MNLVDNKYKLPDVSNYINDERLLNSINDSKLNAFISLTNKNKINNISFEDYPNCLVYGIQRSGKSNFIENIIVNILLKSTPEDSKLVIIDTKRLEYNSFDELPHLLCPIISDFSKSMIAFNKIIIEIQRRYDLLFESGLKTIEKYNTMMHTTNNLGLPKIIVIIDDLLDLVEYSKNETIEVISSIIQKGRQVGIYIIAATSNVSRDMMNINFINLFSNRVCFKAYSERDSRLLLNKKGAEKLGEYEYFFNSSLNIYDGKYKSYKIDNKMVIALVDYILHERSTKYDNFNLELSDNHMVEPDCSREEYDDPLYNEVVDFAIQTGKISASLIQRRFRFGYNRAARILDLLEERGVIGPPNGSRPREVLIKSDDSLNFENNDDLDAQKTDNNVNNKMDDNLETQIIENINNKKINDNPSIVGIIILALIIYAIVSFIKYLFS